MYSRVRNVLFGVLSGLIIMSFCVSDISAQQKGKRKKSSSTVQKTQPHDQHTTPVDTNVDTNPRPGQPGHKPHKEWQGDYPTTAALLNFKVVRTIQPPQNFIGNLTYDSESGRLWLISLGPPTSTNGPSMLYEMDINNGKILAQAEMPFKGDFGDPVFIDGYLYQGIFHESKLYKVAVDKENFGKIVSTVPLPTLNELNLVDESHPLPFIEFGGVGVTPDKKIILHADDVGEFITVEPSTGRLLHRVRTLKALGGLDAVASHKGETLVLANSDPRGGYCALSFPPAISRTPEQKDISWALLNGRTGEVLASIRTQNSRAFAGTVTLLKHEQIPNTAFGKFTFLATGEEGILQIEWTPVVEN